MNIKQKKPFAREALYQPPPLRFAQHPLLKERVKYKTKKAPCFRRRLCICLTSDVWHLTSVGITSFRPCLAFRRPAFPCHLLSFLQACQQLLLQ